MQHDQVLSNFLVVQKGLDCPESAPKKSFGYRNRLTTSSHSEDSGYKRETSHYMYDLGCSVDFLE
jgi:hypothetical protein